MGARQCCRQDHARRHEQHPELLACDATCPRDGGRPGSPRGHLEPKHVDRLVDDVLVICEPKHVDRLVEIIDGLMRDVLGTELNREKCKAYIPERSAAGLGPHPEITAIEQTEGGLPALGAAYGGDFETVLGPFSVASEPARVRLHAATDLAEACGMYAEETHTKATRHAAWCL